AFPRDRAIALLDFAPRRGHERHRRFLLQRDDAELREDLLRERARIARPRDVFHRAGRVLLDRDALCLAARGLRLVKAVALVDDEEAIARLEPVVLALVDEHDLVRAPELVRVDARENTRLDVLVVARRGHDLEFARDRADASAALDRIERLGD